MHAGILGEPQHRPLGIVAERAGRTGRHTGEAERAAADIDFNGTEGRLLGERNPVDCHRRSAVQLAQREPHQAAFFPQRQEARRPRYGRHRRSCAQSIAEQIRIVCLDGRNTVLAKPQSREDRIRQHDALPQSGDIMAWAPAKQKPQRGCAISEGGGDALETGLRHLIDSKREHICRQPVTEPRQRVDQRRAMGLVMQQHDRPLAAGFAIGRQHGPQLAHQRICRRHRIGSRAGRADGRTLATTGAQIRIDAHMVARRRNGAGGAKIEAARAAGNLRARMGAEV